MKQFVIFSLSEQDFAIEIENVNEVTESSEITPMPSGPSELEGMMNLRGNVMPVINLRQALKMDTEASGSSQIMVVGQDDHLVGLMIDNAKDVRNLDEEFIDKSVAYLDNYKTLYKGVMNIDDKLVLILDLHWITNNPDYSLETINANVEPQ